MKSIDVQKVWVLIENVFLDKIGGFEELGASLTPELASLFNFDVVLTK